MRIIINGEAREIENRVNLRELLEKLELPTERVAIELNREVVRKRDWEAVSVADSDRIEIIHFVGGG